MKIAFPLLSRLTGKKILFPCVHIRNISPLGRDLPGKRYYFLAFIYEIFPSWGEIYFGGLLGGKILREVNIQNW